MVKDATHHCAASFTVGRAGDVSAAADRAGNGSRDLDLAGLSPARSAFRNSASVSARDHHLGQNQNLPPIIPNPLPRHQPGQASRARGHNIPFARGIGRHFRKQIAAPNAGYLPMQRRPG